MYGGDTYVNVHIHKIYIKRLCMVVQLCVCHDSIMCGARLNHMCDVTHSCVWRDLFTCVTWLINTCDMTHSYVWHDSLILVPWLIRICDMTHSYVWRDSFIYMSDVAWMHAACHPQIDLYDFWCMRLDSCTCVTWLFDVWNVTFLCVCVCGRRPSSRPLRFFQCSLPSCKYSDRKRRGRGGGGVTGTGGCVENQQECWFLKENSARMCCSMLQHVAVCCYVFLCVADWEIFMSVGFWIKSQWECGAVCLSVS